MSASPSPRHPSGEDGSLRGKRFDNIPRPRERRGRRHSRLISLGYASYNDYLRSPHWAEVKARYRASDRPQECICGETEHLDMHHLTYDRIGAEELSDLTPLCRHCHVTVHELERRGEMGLDFAGLADEDRAALYRLEQRRRYETRFAPIERELEDETVWERIRDGTRQIKHHLRMAVDEMLDRGDDPTELFHEIKLILNDFR